MGRIKRRSGASPSHAYTTPADERPVSAGFSPVLCAEGLSPGRFCRREVWSLPAPVALAPSCRGGSLRDLCPDFGPVAISASCRVSDAHLVPQDEPAPAPGAPCARLPSALPPNRSTGGDGRGTLRPESTRREQPGTPHARGRPRTPGGSRHRQLLAPQCLAGAVALWGPSGEAALEKPRAGALLHGCILCLPSAPRVVSCSSCSRTRHRRSKPRGAAEPTSNRNAACETSRVIFAANKNTHPHATQRFKSCL